MLGANVTIPHKPDVLALVDSLSGEVELTGAANTIVNDSGTLRAYNTDVGGFLRALHGELGYELDGRSVCVLGAGGTARAVIAALSQEEAGRVIVLNRSSDRAAKLADDMAPNVKPRLEWGPLSAMRTQQLEDCDLVVNCTSVGLAGSALAEESPVPVEALPASCLVVDVIANPIQTPLLKDAAMRGHRTLGDSRCSSIKVRLLLSCGPGKTRQWM